MGGKREIIIKYTKENTRKPKMVEEDQDRILEEHIQVVREQAFYMKNCLDKNNLRDALKYSSTMLGEMKTSRLSPRNYFNLCK